MKRVTGTLNEDQYKFFIISLSFIPKMRHVTATGRTENKDTHFMFSDVFRKIVSFMR